jgi:hypothetical protein
MAPASAKPDRRRFIFKMFLLAVAAIVIAMFAAFVFTLGQTMIESDWCQRVRSAVALKENDSEGGNLAIEKVFKDAHTANLPVGVQMNMCREYAAALYKDDEIAAGDAAIDKAIALCPGDPAPQSYEANMLTHAYQDRGWNHYLKYVEDRSLDSGAADQEKSVAVCDKAFGPDHEQTIYKAPTLALIYADSNRPADAEKVMQRCLNSINTKDSSKECAWYVYCMLARMRAIQHRYPEALQAFLTVKKVATIESQRDRAWSEFTTGLTQSQSTKEPAWKKADSLLTKENFDELERLLQDSLSSRKADGMGHWLLDEYYWGLDGGYDVTDEEFTQKSHELKKWLVHNPHSVFARTALAHTYLFSMGKLRSGKLTEEARHQLQSRLKSAREALDGEPNLRKKNPVASSAYVRLLLAEGRDKADLLKIANECHSSFPTYIDVDFWTAKFLSGRWLGSDMEAGQYIQTRADKIGGAKGDEAYAQIYHYVTCSEQNNLVDMPERSSPKWKRIKAGYKKIFKDYPDDMDARLQLLTDAFTCGDSECVASIFDDKKK